MKPMQKLLTGESLTILAFAVILCSFSPIPGGDSYKIYLDNRVVIQEHIYGIRDTPKLVLTGVTDEQIAVTYSHCGKIGTARKLMAKDVENRILKKWDFIDSPDVKNVMTLSTEEITSLPGHKGEINLYYASNELPGGQVLAGIQVEVKTARKK